MPEIIIKDDLVAHNPGSADGGESFAVHPMPILPLTLWDRIVRWLAGRW